MNIPFSVRPVVAMLCCAALGLPLPLAAQALKPSPLLNRSAGGGAQVQPTRTVDFIVALVNSEPVTNFEVRQRLLRVEQQFTQQGVALPSRDELVQQVLEQLVLERAQLQLAKAQGIRVDDATLAQAEQGIAAQNQLSVEDFRRRAAAEGLDINRLREELRNQILLQRLRERELELRVQVSEAEIDDFLRERKGAAAEGLELSLAHVLVQVPVDANEARVRELQARAQGVVDRVRAGADFAAQAREYSDAAERVNGGQFGMRPASRLPELFVDATRNLPPGGIAGPLRSPAGFHVLKLIEKRDAGQAMSVVQNHARHILLRLGPTLSQADGLARLAQMRQQIVSGKATFEALARDNSQDGSASAGGDLGWSNPGQFVPEFEEALNALSPGGISQPLVSRFGVHLIKLDERRESLLSDRAQRELAREQVREKKSEDALRAWAQELRGQAYVEFRDAPAP